MLILLTVKAAQRRWDKFSYLRASHRLFFQGGRGTLDGPPNLGGAAGL